MSHTYSPLRLMILASLPCVCSAAYAEVFTVAAPTSKVTAVAQVPPEVEPPPAAAFGDDLQVDLVEPTK